MRVKRIINKIFAETFVFLYKLKKHYAFKQARKTLENGRKNRKTVFQQYLVKDAGLCETVC